MVDQTTVGKILALREAGEVERAHGTPHHGEYSVAKHCYNMACMLHVLYNEHPAPGIEAVNRLRLFEAILLHDFAERWTGDLPAPVKWAFPEVKAALNVATVATHDVFGLKRVALKEADRWWLKALDIGELYLWCCDQLAMGNTHVKQYMENCTTWVNENRQQLPPVFLEWWFSVHHTYDNNYRRHPDTPWNK